jgi:hypothetical protein
VFSPAVSTRVKQPHQLASIWIQAGDVWSLVMIAVSTRKRKVVAVTLTSMLNGNNMLDMKTNIR